MRGQLVRDCGFGAGMTTIPGGYFITFEGPEAAGKTTHSRALEARLEQEDYEVVCLREPGSTRLGEELRKVVKRFDGPICDVAELMLFSASRAQLVKERIVPSLQQGKVVVCDRFADSTTAYQGYARGLKLESVECVHSIATFGKKPDLTVLLNIDQDEMLRRIGLREVSDRFETEMADFHCRVLDGYLHLAKQEPRRFVVVDSGAPEEETAEVVWEEIQARLKHRLG